MASMRLPILNRERTTLPAVIVPQLDISTSVNWFAFGVPGGQRNFPLPSMTPPAAWKA